MTPTPATSLSDLPLPADTPWVEALGRLVRLSRASAALPDAVREVGLALAYAGRGMGDEARRHGQAALDAGLDRDQAAEALLTGVLHGGMGIFWGNAWLLGAAPAGTGVASAEGDVDTSTVVAYFEEVWGGSLPAWLAAVADADAELLLGYYDVRAVALADGALPKRHKELLIVLMSCVEHYDFGIEVHIRNALACGASPDEVLDAVRAAQVAGGIVAWVAGYEIATRLVAEHAAG